MTERIYEIYIWVWKGLVSPPLLLCLEVNTFVERLHRMSMCGCPDVGRGEPSPAPVRSYQDGVLGAGAGDANYNANYVFKG